MWPGSSSSRGGHSGGGNRSNKDRYGAKRPAPDSDPERAARVASDAGRKRGVRKYTNWGLAPPRAFARCEVEEYDREMAAAARGSGARRPPGSSSGAGGAGSSAIARAPLPPPKREGEEQGLAPRPGRLGFLPGDYVDDGDLDGVIAEIMERTKDEPQQLVARRQMEEELDEFRFRQAIKKSRTDRGWGASDSDSD